MSETPRTAEELRDALVADYHMQLPGDGWTPDDLAARLDAIIDAARAEADARVKALVEALERIANQEAKEGEAWYGVAMRSNGIARQALARFDQMSTVTDRRPQP